MATNQMYADANQFDVPASAVAPESATSGDAVLVGDLPGVALTDPYTAGDGTSRITVKTNGAYDLPVQASGSAVDYGDRVYITAAGAVTNASGSGNSPFGYALGTVDNASTGIIPVKIGN